MRETKFKHTDIGCIPHDWEEVTLNQIKEGIQTGPFGSQLHQSDYSKYGIPLVMPKDLIDGRISEQTIATVNENHVERLKRHKINEGDILFSRRGDVGRCAFASKKEAGWLCGTGCLRVSLNKEKADYHFITYLFQKKDIVAWLINNAVGTTMLNLNTSILANVPLAIPARTTEQNRIATALMDMDELIQDLQKLITKKQNIKSGTMQLLLSGKKRLSGFNKPWEEVEIQGITGKIRRGQTLKSDHFLSGDIPVVAGGKQYAGFHNVANQEGRTITISGSGASAGYVAIHHIPIFATDCSIIKESKSFSLDYLYYSLLSKQEELYELQTGGAQPHVYPRDIEKIILSIPSDLDEQCAIAKVLTDMDDEIQMLQTRLQKYINLKQGMMQQLLTGKIRLI